MASEGDVVFSREQVSCDEKDSDIWDDSALIQAYDKAVHAMKIALDNDEEIHVDDLKEEEGGSITTETDEKTEETDDKTEDRDNKAERNNEKNSVIDEKTNAKSVVEAEVSSSSMVRKKTKKRGKPKGSRRWMPGDQCIALYSEDQLWYPAEILSINPQRRTCLVRYTYYGNEEEQNLKDLSSLDQEGEFVQLYSGNTAVEGTSGSKKWSQYKNSEADGSPSRYESWWRDYHQKYGSYQPPPSQPHLPPPPSGQGHGSQMPPPPPFPWAGNMPGFPMWPPRPGRPEKPPPIQMPPLPPPPAVTDGLEDDDSLACMLMAWYMSGYHTGYYQGLKDAKTAGRPSRLGSRSPGSVGSRRSNNAERWGWE
ncbi:survival motor neuron protein-like isoform X2 [Branchiostoma lanceolatum]|uniref:survival motor neuron protein-like isoform X2 n=1 Tax=Branchiostoma lanceolatum TaxID=7740 RepID=UPI003453C39F